MKLEIIVCLLCFVSLTNAYSYKRRKNCVKRPLPFPPTYHYYRPRFPPMPFPRWPQWNVPAPTPVALKFFEIGGQPAPGNDQILPLFPQPQPPIDVKPVIPDNSGPVIVDPVNPVIEDSGPLRGDLAPGRDIVPPVLNGKPCNAMSNNCAIGEVCMYIDQSVGNSFVCPSATAVSCTCQPGCRHGDLFISLGNTVSVDQCGSKCSCLSLYGTVSCDKKAC
ncbi:uncharacterized protein LOC134266065 [Saccostrea cucullata]|uniref:uncharacterized protein LOC134266065 n=1 Tax=Saccostrea cuccullata TaxID=36930 RepID=UPI002ED3FDB7